MALIFGGTPTTAPANVANTESFDGTSWTEVADLATTRGFNIGGGGSNTSALAFGGESPSGTALTATEEWESPNYAVKTVTTS